jgi:very-short-patch-repair endonuclease
MTRIKQGKWGDSGRQLLLRSMLESLTKETGIAHEREFRFHPTRKWRFDAAFPEARVALEIEGGVWVRGRHNRASGFLKDMEKYNEAAALGWRVIRTPWEWIEDGSIVPKVVAAILHEDGDDINGDLQ